MILPIVVVYLLTRAFWWTSDQPRLWSAIGLPSAIWVEGLLKVALWVLPCVVLLKVLRRETWRDAWSELGLLHPAWRGIGLMLLATLPMMALPLTSARTRLDAASIASFCVLGPLAEEVLYRGFLFQQLWQRARWPGWVAALGSSVVFALAHHRNLDEVLLLGFLQQDLGTSIATIGPPTVAAIAGGMLFCWITWRWRSLWPAIALHGAVNFWWDISARPDATAAAIAQGIALAAAVGLTMWKGRIHRESGI